MNRVALPMTSTPAATPDLLEKVVTNLRQAPRLHLPVGRDLRRLPLHLRLRPARASTCCATSRTPGGAPWSSCATTSSGLDAAILGPPAVWDASGHLATFTDPLVDCKNCQERWREDKIDGVCPNCGSHRLHRGPGLQPDVQDPRRTGRGRGRTSPTCDRRRPRACSPTSPTCSATTRKKPPFGIAQVGKSFRNEITPQNFVFRTREFEQMEMEYFVPPADADEWYDYWMARASGLVPRPGHPGRTSSGCTSTTQRSSRTTRAARPTSSSPSPGAGTNSRASPTAATTT